MASPTISRGPPVSTPTHRCTPTPWTSSQFKIARSGYVPRCHIRGYGLSPILTWWTKMVQFVALWWTLVTRSGMKPRGMRFYTGTFTTTTTPTAPLLVYICTRPGLARDHQTIWMSWRNSWTMLVSVSIPCKKNILWDTVFAVCDNPNFWGRLACIAGAFLAWFPPGIENKKSNLATKSSHARGLSGVTRYKKNNLVGHVMQARQEFSFCSLTSLCYRN